MSGQVVSLFLGSQQETRLGPLTLPMAQDSLIVVAEPLKWTNLILSNTTAAPLTATIWLVPVGGTPVSDDQIFLGTQNVSGHTLITFEFNVPLNQQDQLWAEASGDGMNFIGTFSRRNR